MSVTVDVVDDPSVRLDDVTIGAVPPETVEFAVEGSVAVSGGLLRKFEGRSLRPVAVAMSVDDSSVVVDLGDDCTLLLDSVDVGVETPGTGGLPTGADDVPSTPSDLSAPSDLPEATEADVGAVAFEVAGTIGGVDSAAVEALSRGRASIESVTFAVEDPLVGDGGTGDDVVLDVSFLGVRVVVLRDGTITVGDG